MSLMSSFAGTRSRWSRLLPNSLATASRAAWAASATWPRWGLTVITAAMIALVVQPVRGQGGATMSAGQSMQNSANSAAGQANRNAGGAAPVTGTSEMSTPPSDPSGLGGYSGAASGSADYPGYGYGSGIPGGAGPGRGGIAPGNVAGMVGGGIAGSLAEFFNRPLAGADGFQPTIFEQAALAAHRGDQRLALALYHAHLIAERDSAADALSSVRFSPMLRRPVWGLRLGVSINTRAPADLADDPQPIRDGDNKTSPRSRNNSASSADYDYESSSIPNGSLEEMSGSSAPVSGADSLTLGAPLSTTPSTSAAEPRVGTAEVEELLDRDLGLVAEIIHAELARRVRDGRFGPALAELTSKGAALAAKAPQNSAGGEGLPTWAPGVEFVGSGIAAQVIEKARANQVDLLVHFEVIAKPLPRSEESQYQARCRVVNVANGETLGASKLLDRREVTLAARRSNVRAVVDELLSPALKALDTKGSVAAMPALTSQQALARIDTLLSSRNPSRMVNLAEIATFHHLGLIDEDQLQQAVYYAAGDEGLLLLHADYEQRREVAKQMVERELGQN